MDKKLNMNLLCKKSLKTFLQIITRSVNLQCYYKLHLRFFLQIQNGIAMI